MLSSCHHCHRCLAWKKAPYSICCWWGTYFDFLGVENLAKYKRTSVWKNGIVLCYCNVLYVVVPFIIISIKTKIKPEGRLTRSKTACVRDLHSFEDGLALLRLVFQHYACEDLNRNENYCPHFKHLHNYLCLIFKINITSLHTTNLARSHQGLELYAELVLRILVLQSHKLGKKRQKLVLSPSKEESSFFKTTRCVQNE